METKIILSADLLGVKLYRRGKVRDVYDLESDLLIISTDRVSCFDVVLSDGIPYKGKVLTALSIFWFDFIKDIIGHHFITSEINQYPAGVQKYASLLRGRSMLVKKTSPILVECVVRGYLSGSGWKEYRQRQSVCGINLPQGIPESGRLPEPLFTPSTKADVGHDVNVGFTYVQELIGRPAAERIKEMSIAIYKKASDYALTRGIIIADTKLEFGFYNNEIILIDEALTPDSSRFWPSDQYQPGRSQPSFDKQFLRDYLEGLSWQKTPPAPKLPPHIIQKTSQKYLEAYQKLIGKELEI